MGDQISSTHYSYTPLNSTSSSQSRTIPSTSSFNFSHRPKPVVFHKKKFPSKASSSKLKQLKKQCKMDTNSHIKIKIPLQNNNVKFKWIDQQICSYPQNISLLSLDLIKKTNFQQKLSWLKSHLLTLKKNWNHGHQLVHINREQLISSSFNSLTHVNLFKELKVSFIGDGAEDAGGGLLRQWMHLCVKQIMSQSTALFKLNNTDETAYQLLTQPNNSTSYQTLHLLGLIIGKAILQGIPLNCCLDHTIIRQLCSQPIYLQDLYSYDKKLYQSFVTILKMSNIEDLTLNGTIYHQYPGRRLQQKQLFVNGKNTPITQSNKQMYITQMIHFYCTKIIQNQLQSLCKALYSVIPPQLLSIFQPYQFDMLINGPNIIDIQDLKNNTIYDKYQRNQQVIKWFWEIVESYDQNGYRNLLHYVTGSTRVPIMGFSKLQTSNGHIKKFTIRKIPQNRQNPYPKSYTCFNRLDLPSYSTKQQMKNKLHFILDQQFTFFGLC